MGLDDVPFVIGGSRGRTLLVGPSESASGYGAIQDAINAAESGDVIYVQPGSYDENLVVTTDYLTLVGAQLGGYGRPDVDVTTGIALVVRAQGFVCKRLRFTNSTNADTVRIEGNGFHFDDCVFDGNALQATVQAVVRIWTHASDDSFTGSEGIIQNSLIRGGGAKGLAFDCQHAAVGVLPTDDVLDNVRFADNVAEDIFLGATAVSVADMKRCVFHRCHVGIGGKNKATHIDIKTNKIGTANTSVFEECFINDDTPDTTALKVDGTGASFIGCYNLDGVINGDGID
jgi:pectin methylesterase-like acyl-CoA thioesterase